MKNEELREEVLEETETQENLPKTQQTEETAAPPQEENGGVGEACQNSNNDFTPPYFNYAPSRFYKPLPKGVTEETYDEYSKISKCGKILGVTAIVISAAVTVYTLVLGLISGLLASFGMDITKYLADPAINVVTNIFLSIVMYTLPFMVAAWVNRFRIGDLAPLGKSREGTVLPYFLFGLGFCAFAQVAISQAAALFERIGFSYDLPEGENPEGLFGFLLSVIATAVVPAFMEELGCRGIMFGIAEKKGGTTFALIVSSAMFGLIHGNFIQIPFAFLVGLILGIIRIKTGSLWICILVHGVNNFASVCMDYFFSGKNEEIGNVVYSIFLILCMISALLSVALLSKKEKDEYVIEDDAKTIPSNTVTLSKKLLWFFKTPAIIVSIILFVGEACLYFLV